MAWDDVVLCTDEDLTKWEARMPELGQGVKGSSGASAYDGKRDLAKKRITGSLVKMGLNPEGIKNPEQLRDAATFLELSLVFRDMAFRDDNAPADKAHYYLQQYEDEMDGIQLDYEDPTPEVVTPRIFGAIQVRRA